MAQRQMQLLVIDPQNDFCDLPEGYCPARAGERQAPTLPVAGAHAHMQRLAGSIDAGRAGFHR